MGAHTQTTTSICTYVLGVSIYNIMDLFSSEMSRKSQLVPLKDATITLTSHFYTEEEANKIYKTLFS